MKHLITLTVIAFCCYGSIHAQLFQIGPDTVMVEGTADELFLEAHTTLVNTQDTAINVGWQREVLSGPAEWINYLCSDFLCFLPESDSGNIFVLPNQEMDVNMTFFPQDVAGGSVVRVTFFDTTDVAGSSVSVIFQCNAEEITSVELPGAFEAKLFPNPATGSITLSANRTFTSTSIMDVRGRLVASHGPVREIDVSDLPPGVYHLFMRRNDELQVVPFIKR